jgi:geranylgeranylglycerol-phosphate geranylgeranyltransferase
MTSVTGVIRLIRPINCAMMGFAVVVGEFIALSGSLPTFRALLGFPVAFLLTAATMILNDYYDRSIDKINNPERPIPSGAVSPRAALALVFLLSTLGILTSALVNSLAMIIALLSLVLMVFYNTVGKRTGFLGNIVVSVCVSLPFVFGGYAVQNMRLLLWIFAFVALFSNLGREVTKGIADVAGDRAHGVRTVAVVFGSGIASLAASSLFAVAILLSAFPHVLDLVSKFYLPAVVVSDLGFVTSAISLLRNHSVENAKAVKNRILIWMMIGLVAFLLGAYVPIESNM